MRALIEIDPESTAYIFGNAFHYRWFAGVEVVGKTALSGTAKKKVFKNEHGEAAMHVALGGTVKVKAMDPKADRFKWVTVTRKDFERAYTLYLTGDPTDPESGPGAYPSDLLDGSGDVNCCDAWLQYAVFGKLVYG